MINNGIETHYIEVQSTHKDQLIARSHTLKYSRSPQTVFSYRVYPLYSDPEYLGSDNANLLQTHGVYLNYSLETLPFRSCIKTTVELS